VREQNEEDRKKGGFSPKTLGMFSKLYFAKKHCEILYNGRKTLTLYVEEKEKEKEKEKKETEEVTSTVMVEVW